MKRIFFTILFTSILLSCTESTLPKPQGYLRLEYPIAKYETYQHDCPFSFGKNIYTQIRSKQNCDFLITYPEMKADIYISYKQINNNLDSLLLDAQRFTYQHTKRAETIIEQPFVNPEARVYGMYYDVGGNAASATQFYLTDSLYNFILGSVYFNIKPNNDSILPASHYIKKDIRLLIESFEWNSY